MSQGESLISILLAVIAFLLYQIVKQLTYLTGKKIKFTLFQKPAKKYELPEDKPKSKKEEKLAN